MTGKRTTGVVLGFAALLAGVALAEISPRALTVNGSAVTDVERKSFADGNPAYDAQKPWYDRTKALGYEYYLIDAGWKDWRDGEMDQWACLKKWIDYGKSITATGRCSPSRTIPSRVSMMRSGWISTSRRTRRSTSSCVRAAASSR